MSRRRAPTAQPFNATPPTAVAPATAVARPNAPAPPAAVSAPPVMFTVLAVALDAGCRAAALEEDIRDIRGPKLILPAWVLPAVLAGALLLALLAFAAWRWRRRRRRPRALLSFEIALQRLESIRALLQPERAREFSTEVSDTIRVYIEQRFDVTATHQTTEEFLRDLLVSSNASLARHRALLSAFLHQCDLVKFAGISLTLQNMESLHASARTFVLETAKPEPDAPAPQAPTGPQSTVAPQPTMAPQPRRSPHDSLPSA